mmetsp:Transcript_7009/g.17530  ORF Transcript_7009/g.17530 Transcript_7009/m.17530 type:complete len:212 (+) Transcript_7009:940-1575(+)
MVGLGGDGVQQRIHLKGLLVEVKLDGAVINLHVGNLLHNHLELVMREGRRAVRHHRVRSGVKLVVVSIQKNRLLPEVMALASVGQLWDVQLRCVHLDEIHKLLRLVLRVKNRELRVHADVGALVAEACIQERDQLLEVAMLFVLHDELFEVVGVNDNVHRRDLGALELLRRNARGVELLPDLRIVGLPSRVNGLRVLPEVHVARGKFRVVR